MRSGRVYLLLITGELADAKEFISNHYPGRECVVLSKRELREAGWRGQIKALSKIRGEALVFFRQSLSELQEPQLALWSAALHHCHYTVLADSSGRALVSTRWTLIRVLPRTVASALSDLLVFVAGWCLLRMLRSQPRSISAQLHRHAGADLVYLYPFPLDTQLAGGQLSHVKGFLGGVALAGARCEVFSGRSLPVQESPVNIVPAKRSLFLFHESKLLSYNLRLALTVHRALRRRRSAVLYQRHTRFIVVGALLSTIAGFPFILEYNGSEVWVANHWDPARFRSWLRLCEDVSLERAQLIVVVSEALKQELLQRGIPENRVLLNPNGVDPAAFQPGRGGDEIRMELGLKASDIVVGFIGTFNYWHGITVLEQAIHQLLQDQARDDVIPKLRFLLVGDGLLRAEMRDHLGSYLGSKVFFTGVVPHARIAGYLDAADILVSPHVPMPDGRPFFGSPTKIFEYMAMAKGIIASNLDQLSSVLKHGRSAWLVRPGDAAELASAIVLLARDPALRSQLGQNARAAASAEHTWRQNAERVLARISASSHHELRLPT